MRGARPRARATAATPGLPYSVGERLGGVHRGGRYRARRKVVLRRRAAVGVAGDDGFTTETPREVPGDLGRVSRSAGHVAALSSSRPIIPAGVAETAFKNGERPPKEARTG